MSYSTLAEKRAEIAAEKRGGHTYADLEREHRVNRYYLWHLIHDPNYIPPNRILQMLHIPAPSQVIGIDGPIPNGSQALGAQPCACGAWYLSNHPRRRRCYGCSPYRGRRKIEHIVAE